MATNSTLDKPNLEIFTLIWLDHSVNKPENIKTQTILRQLTDQFKSFDNCEECELYIQSSSLNERIVLIVSGRLGREIIPRIHPIEQIYLIYVYCFDREANLQWAKSYSKIQEVLTTQQELFEHIRDDNQRELSPVNNESLYIQIHQNDPDDEFIHSQLLINYLLKLKTYSTIDPQFFTLYKTENLEEFQAKYSPETSLWWLTKDKFFSELISKSLHTKDIDLLYLTRFFLRDVHQQLELHQCQTPIHVYHSHFINTEEFEELKTSIGKLISINNFFLTTYQRDKALFDLNQSSDLIKILFEIDADPSLVLIKPFANITSLSSSTKHSQILFMFGSIFRLKNLFQENDIWICQMDLSSENDLELQPIFEEIQNEDGDKEKDILAFGNILARINQYVDAEKYYLHILPELPIDHPNTHICYRNLGNLAYLKKDDDQSVGYHLKSLEIKKRLLNPTDLSLADSYNCLGIVYFHQNAYKQAVEFYTKGLHILQLNLDENYDKVVLCWNNIALVYRMEENYSQGLEACKKIFEIETKYHMNFGETYHNLGAFYWCLGFYDDAMKYYKLSLENKYKNLPKNDLSIAMTLENMGLIYENKNDYQQALQCYRDAEKIYQQTLPITDSNVLQIREDISRVTC